MKRFQFVMGVFAGVAFVACSSVTTDTIDMATNAMLDMVGADSNVVNVDGSQTADSGQLADAGGDLGDRSIGADSSFIDIAKADAHETGVSCTPDTAFCGSGRVYQCTKSGLDAFQVQTCTGGTATNGVVCATDKCQPSTFLAPGACCRTEKPLAAYALSAPSLGNGDQFDWGSKGYQTNAYRTCDKIYWTVSNATAVCTPQSLSLTVGVNAAGVNAGQQYSVASNGFVMNLSSAGVACTSWTGTYSVSAAPTTTITLNATCAESGKGSMQVIGSLTFNE